MPPALTGSMLSHAAQAASFNQIVHPTHYPPVQKYAFLNAFFINKKQM
jgi:hypothetical protein